MRRPSWLTAWSPNDDDMPSGMLKPRLPVKVGGKDGNCGGGSEMEGRSEQEIATILATIDMAGPGLKVEYLTAVLKREWSVGYQAGLIAAHDMIVRATANAS